MKILHFIYDHISNPWVGGGGAVRTYEIYRRLSKKHHITVVCGKYPGAKDYTEGSLEFHFIGTDKNNYALSTFCYTIKAFAFLLGGKVKADVIVEDFAPYNPIFSFLRNKPVILQVHHREGVNLLKRYYLFGLPFLIIEKFYPRLFKNLLCVSEASKKKFALNTATVIPNGIDSSLLETTPTDGDYIAYVGRLHIHNKGLDTLIEAMTLNNLNLSIAGKGKDEHKLRTLINNAGISQRVTLKGYLNDKDKIKFISGAKCFVLPSRYEGQGIVVLEAAACGKPVVVSDIPELSFAVQEGFGISFKTGDATDLAEKLTYLINNESLTKHMGEKARQYAKNCTWDSIAEQYEKLLTDVVKAGHG
jgi:glycosyltransferase involved in cell wall biosynthesis